MSGPRPEGAARSVEKGAEAEAPLPRLWVVAATLASSLLAGASPVGAVLRCSPAAELQGDEALVAAIAADLQRRGVATSPRPACPAVRARIEKLAGGTVGVAIEDADGRTSERTAHGVEAAATLIESWTRADVVAPLLAPRPRVAQNDAEDPARIASAVDVQSLPHVTAISEPPSGEIPPALSFTASGETSFATDGSLWLGLSAGVCFRLGPVCAGVLARAGRDMGPARGEDNHTGRLATDLLVAAGLPLQKGRLTLLPGLALGVGWIRTEATRSSIDWDAIDVDSGGLRTSASLQASLRVSQHIALEMGIVADLSPLARTESYETQALHLAGEPRGYLRGGLGVRIGAP